MYAQHFGLRHEPFSIAPDPRYLFMSEQHREALAHLLYGVNGGGGFVLLTGEVGAGKTTVCRCFLEQVPKRCNVAYIFNPKLTVGELLKTICDEFRVPVELSDASAAPTVKDYLDPLNEFLLKTHAVGQNSVLIIDEAQNLSSDVLEQLRLLTNLETSERKLLQIILIGQPELRDLLAKPELEQLAQRVIARFHLDALTEAESLRYIRHRLSVAGQSAQRPFERKAMQRIHKLSRGIPRRINLLADRALLGAYASGAARVSPEIVDQAAAEVFGRRERARMALGRLSPSMVLAGGVALGALLVGAIALAVGRGGSDTAVEAKAGVGSVDGALGRTAPGAEAGRSEGVPGGVPGGAAASSAGSNVAMAPADAPTASGAPSATAAAGRAGASATASTTAATPATAATAAMPATAVTAATSGAGAGAGAGATAPLAAATSSGAVRQEAATAAVVPASAAAAAPASALRDQRQAWLELARLWSLPPNLDDPCKTAAERQIQCFRGVSSIDALRLLDRPAILTLSDAAERPVYAVMTALGSKGATLRMGVGQRAVSQTVSLASLARMWQGEFATMWRAPAGYAGMLQQGASGPAVQQLTTQLATAQGTAPPRNPLAFDGDVRSRVNAFQQANGLKPDGVAGPTTFMLLNRATGVDEPRLAAGA